MAAARKVRLTVPRHLSQSSTYESIYEPINPRPQSQMSSRSTYSTGSSLYAPYGTKGKAPASGAGAGVGGGGTSQQPRNATAGTGVPVPQGKEAEVDALTNLLVRSMDSSSDPDFFGTYVKGPGVRSEFISSQFNCRSICGVISSQN